VISENPDSLKFKNKCKSYYNKNGFIEKTEFFYFENIVDGRSEFEYDSNDLLKEVTHYKPKDEMIGKASYQYYDDGTRKSYVFYGPDDNKINKTYCKYDDKGNRIEEKVTEFWSGEETDVYSLKLKYNDLDQLIEKEYIEENQEYYSKHIYTYDNKGFLIEQNISNLQLELTKNLKYSYSDFDENNNWTKSLKFQNDSLVSVDVKEIEYYE